MLSKFDKVYSLVLEDCLQDEIPEIIFEGLPECEIFCGNKVNLKNSISDFLNSDRFCQSIEPERILYYNLTSLQTNQELWTEYKNLPDFKSKQDFWNEHKNDMLTCELYIQRHAYDKAKGHGLIAINLEANTIMAMINNAVKSLLGLTNIISRAKKEQVFGCVFRNTYYLIVDSQYNKQTKKVQFVIANIYPLDGYTYNLMQTIKQYSPNDNAPQTLVKNISSPSDPSDQEQREYIKKTMRRGSWRSFQ